MDQIEAAGMDGPRAVRRARLSALAAESERNFRSRVCALLARAAVLGALPDAYEINYLITPDLGGAANIRNLWPQPYDTAWNARVKDQLEERLHSMACNGEIDLGTAQHDLAADWIAAYEKYFYTNRPDVGHPKARYAWPSRYPAMNWRYEVLVARLPVRMSLRRARSLL